MRIDQALVQRGLASSRSQAQRLLAAGVQWRQGGGWRTALKNGDEVPPDAELRLLDAAESRYVSRGGLKLEAALAQTGRSVQGGHALDLGQSTGGFTDCLLQQGAATVLGVDVGRDQLHARLRSDPRVLALQGLNARHLKPSDWIASNAYASRDRGIFWRQASDGDPPRFDCVVMDLSFISQTLVLPVVASLLLRPGGFLLSLVKPQFELQPHQIGKGGIVRDATLYPVVEERLRQCCADLGLRVTHWLDSAIAGGDGNREFFICAEPA